MEKWFYFFLSDKSSVAEGLQELLLYGVQDLSTLEEAEEQKVYFCGKGKDELLTINWTHIEGVKEIQEEIDWEKQWELFCPYYTEGVCKIPLSDFSKKSTKHLILSPGGGFGDLSHPTTCLMMELMDQYVEDKVVADLGCGSGILGLFSLLLGAKKVYGLDIDPNALTHTEENAKLNGLKEHMTLGVTLPEEAAPEVLLLNMIWEEQKMALSSFPTDKCAVWITSGVLKEQEKEYLLFMESFSLRKEKVLEKEGWLGFVFKRV